MNPNYQSSVYAAAPLVAAKVATHFARYLRESPPGEGSATTPDTLTIETMVNTAFWTSLRREEGYSPRLSLAYLSPDQAVRTMKFAEPLPFDPHTITKLSPAIQSVGGYLGVWHNPQHQLTIWGVIRILPQHCFVMEILEPALLVVKQNRGTVSGKLTNILILSGEEVKEIDESGTACADCPEIVSALLHFGAADLVEAEVSVPIQLAMAMRRHGRGGSLLIVPENSSQWLESLVLPLPYAVSPPLARLAELVRESADVPVQNLSQEFHEDLKFVINALAGLTAADGATVLNDKYELAAFGAKIKRRAGQPQIEEVLLSEPVIGNQPSLVRLIEYGGTRHLSAAQFVQDQPEAIALVCSQDGRFTVFAWSPQKKMVHGYRVEALLL